MQISSNRFNIPQNQNRKLVFGNISKDGRKGSLENRIARLERFAVSQAILNNKLEEGLNQSKGGRELMDAILGQRTGVSSIARSIATERGYEPEVINYIG
jgi:hypothetical protein